MNYPSDWLCVVCERKLEQHVKIGTPNEDIEGTTPAARNWCFSFKENSNPGDKRRNWFFIPASNLEYLEIKVCKS